MLVPKDISPFFEEINREKLLQGDILKASVIGLKDESSQLSPDYWLIISKSCDLALEVKEGVRTTRRRVIKILPLISIKILNKIYRRDFENAISRVGKKVALVALVPFAKAFHGMRSENVPALLKNEISKYMFIPPDGRNFSEPMVVDFDISHTLDTSNPEEFEKILTSKTAQLATPFRERLAQRYAAHFSTIGIDDECIKDKSYVAEVKKLLTKSEK